MITNVKLLKKETIARDTMAFYFEKPAGFEFRAGQFADYTLINPPETDEEGNTRGFSFITAPFEANIGAATRMRDTAFKRVLKDLAIGDEVKLDGPYGDFTLHKTESTPAVFIIGGIGVTPVRSMVAQAAHDRTQHKIILIHANRILEDAPFKLDFERLAEQNHNFRYIPVVTDEAPTTSKLEHGRVDEAMLKRYIAELNSPIYYLSGPEAMVKAIRQLLVGLKVNEDNIRTEEFAGY